MDPDNKQTDNVLDLKGFEYPTENQNETPPKKGFLNKCYNLAKNTLGSPVGFAVCAIFGLGSYGAWEGRQYLEEQYGARSNFYAFAKCSAIDSAKQKETTFFYSDDPTLMAQNNRNSSYAVFDSCYDLTKNLGENYGGGHFESKIIDKNVATMRDISGVLDFNIGATNIALAPRIEGGDIKLLDVNIIPEEDGHKGDLPADDKKLALHAIDLLGYNAVRLQQEFKGVTFSNDHLFYEYLRTKRQMSKEFDEAKVTVKVFVNDSLDSVARGLENMKIS